MSTIDSFQIRGSFYDRVTLREFDLLRNDPYVFGIYRHSPVLTVTEVDWVVVAVLEATVELAVVKMLLVRTAVVDDTVEGAVLDVALVVLVVVEVT